MKEELDSLLVKKYPKIFRDRHAPMNVTAMCWGFDHDDGWFDIISNACWLIQHHIDDSRKKRLRALLHNRAIDRNSLRLMTRTLTNAETEGKNPPQWAIDMAVADLKVGEKLQVPEVVDQVIATQIKEKFGTLRFYYHGGDEYIEGIVRMAESMSATTCEVCGAHGKQRGGGWIRTLCDKHAQEDGRNIEEDEIEDQSSF
jgi:hypothetical protein